MRSDQRGFSALILITIVSVLLAVPAYLYASGNLVGLKSVATDVKGASTKASTGSGFNVFITSQSPTWDLVEYLCTSKEECLTSLNSGRRFGTVSGGETDLHEVVLSYTPEWGNYKYVKYYVRSGLQTSGAIFRVLDEGDIPGTEVETITDGTARYTLVLIPISAVKESFYTSATISDR